jgi:thiol-disulfide isomerase/thioredoxin
MFYHTLKTLCVGLILLVFFACKQNEKRSTTYRALIVRADSLPIAFTIMEEVNADSTVWTIINAGEKILVEDIVRKEDSLLINLPFFEAQLNLEKTSNGYQGIWYKRTSTGEQRVPILIEEENQRLVLPGQKSKYNVSGRWSVVFTKDNGKENNAVAEFEQVGDSLKGTFLTSTGDYRYLEGIVKDDSLVMSTFDGTHAYFFSGKIMHDGKIDRGVFASGPVYKESWVAVKDSLGSIDETKALMQLKGVENKLHFRFPDLDSNMVGIADNRFKNKVVIVQIMGSWCPNCMDETSFLSSFYKENAAKGVEVIGLAYEYINEFSIARKNLLRFKNKFDVQYPMLITGVTSADSLRTEKSLPEMTEIKAFPSMILIGKDGTVRKTHAGYAGPATGIHHVTFKQKFTEDINALLAEELK